MKKTTIILLAAAIALLDFTFGPPCYGQTNIVKISALPIAGTITGTEIFPFDQSGVTVTATLNQLLALAESQTAAASNFLWRATGTNTANLGTVSNNVTALGAGWLASSNGVLTVSNLTVTVSNQVQLVNAGLLLASNAVASAGAGIVTASNAIIALNTVTNGLQGQINTIDATLGNVPGSGGTASFGRIITPAYAWPSAITVSGAASVNTIDFSKGSVQTVNISDTGLSYPCYFEPINWQNGDNVFLRVVCTSGNAEVGSYSTVTGGTVDNWGGGTSSAGGYYLNLSGTVKEAMLNWTVTGTVLNFSISVHP